MEQAKKKVKELMDEYPGMNEFIKNQDREKLKPEINELLYQYLPHDITMKEMDIISNIIYDMINDPYDFVRKDVQEFDVKELQNKTGKQH